MNFNECEKVVFKDEKGKYTVGVSTKKQDGSYESAYFPIQFKKGVELDNKTKIKIKNAFLTFYKWEYQDKKGTTFFIKCLDFEKVGETQKSNIDVYKEFGQQMEISEQDLPF